MNKEKQSFGRVLWKIIRVILIIIAVILVGAVIMLFAISPAKIDPLKDQNGKKYPNGIAERVMIDVGDMKLGAFLLGEDVDNPVLLYMHGGPGMPVLFMDDSHYFPERLEKYFTVCYLDQRGVGASYDKNMPLEKLNDQLMIEDTKAVTDYLIERFDQEKIYLFGISWGTCLTTQTAHKYPDSYMAVINTGQVADSVRSERETYDYLSRLAEENNDEKSLALLQKYNPDMNPKALITKDYLYDVRAPIVEKYKLGSSHFKTSSLWHPISSVLTFKGYTVMEKLNIYKGSMLSLEHIQASENIMNDFTKQEVPFFIIMGEYDFQTTANLAREFYDKMDAPIKEFVLFKNAAHFISGDYPQDFAKYVASVIDKVEINRDSTSLTNEYEMEAEPEFFEDFVLKK